MSNSKEVFQLFRIRWQKIRRRVPKMIWKNYSEKSPLFKVARVWRISTAPESSPIDSRNTIANIGNDINFCYFSFLSRAIVEQKRERKWSSTFKCNFVAVHNRRYNRDFHPCTWPDLLAHFRNWLKITLRKKRFIFLLF